MGVAREGGNRFNKLRWSLIIFLFINVLLIFALKNPDLLAWEFFVLPALLFIIVLLHAMERYGIKNTVIFFVITAGVSFFFENLSVATGFPFGLYHYSPDFGMLPVPFIIIFGYFGLGYLSWILAHVLTGQYCSRLGGKQIFLVPLIATFIMVMWDLTIDPISSTLQGLWVWQDPGAYFGVPLSNFFGWFLVSFVFFQLFAGYISRYDQIDPEKIADLSKKLSGVRPRRYTVLWPWVPY